MSVEPKRIPRFLTADAGVRDRLPMVRVESLGSEDLEPMTSTSVLSELSLRKCIQISKSPVYNGKNMVPSRKR